MTLDSTTSWLLMIGFCALMVGMYSWSRFDEPSYDSQSEYYARYKPRYSTSHTRYIRARLGYVIAILIVYLVFALVPELFYTLSAIDSGSKALDSGSKTIESSKVPLAVALGLITLQNVSGLRDLERKIRGFLHSIARVPEGVRRTVAHMRGSRFEFDDTTVALLMRKLGITPVDGAQDAGSLSKLISADDVLYTWYSVGSVLAALSEQCRSRCGIDPLFFDQYKEELENIRSRHIALTESIRQYVKGNPGAAGSGANSPGDDSTVVRDVRDLRDRLYTFVACGVHSSVKDDAAGFGILRRLGFTDHYSGDEQRGLGAFIRLGGLSFIAVTILSIFTGYCTQGFNKFLDTKTPDGPWASFNFGLPGNSVELYSWTWKAALFYFVAVAGALTIRNTRVARRDWFDINNLRREIPVLRYVPPAFLGTLLACGTLVAIQVSDILIDNPAANLLGALRQAFPLSVPWFPLPMVMAFAVLILSDLNFADDRKRWRTIFLRSLVCGLVMGVVGFLTAQITLSNGLDTFVKGRRPPPEVSIVGTYVSLYLGGLIACLSGIFASIVQFSEVSATRNMPIADGSTVDALSTHGPMFSLRFESENRARLCAAATAGVPPGSLREGNWQRFPEGIAIKWSTASGMSGKEGDFGLVSTYGDSLIYEGFWERFSRAPDFIAQLRVQPASGE